jgi:hypothetical protein
MFIIELVLVIVGVFLGYKLEGDFSLFQRMFLKQDHA